MNKSFFCFWAKVHL